MLTVGSLIKQLQGVNPDLEVVAFTDWYMLREVVDEFSDLEEQVFVGSEKIILTTVDHSGDEEE